MLSTLKRLQRRLGRWHDREIADRMIAESLARPKILLREFRAAQTLLKELEKDDRRQKAAAEEILRAARAAAGTAESSERPPLLLAFSRT
jgi:CHAD domain-containing protein